MKYYYYSSSRFKVHLPLYVYIAIVQCVRRVFSQMETNEYSNWTWISANILYINRLLHVLCVRLLDERSYFIFSLGPRS